MSQAMHLMANNVAGCGVSEGWFLPCSGVSGRTASVFSCSSQGYHRIYSRVKNRGLQCSSKGASLVCEARRSPESFSRQNKHGFSRSRNWLNEGRDSFENFEEDMLSSKNGTLVSHSSTPKHQANAAPRPREKEIVALFKKVQARLRERATTEEEKKVETSQAQSKENGSVHSLVKLLRKHSVEQVKSSGVNREKNLSLDQYQNGDQDNESQGTKFSDLDGTPNNESQETNISFAARPPSNFQRWAPRLKYQPVFYDDNDVNAVPLSNGIREKDQDQIGMKLDPGPEHDSDLELDPKDELFFPEVGIADMSQDDSLDSEQIYNDEHGEDQQVEQHEDLSTMKLSELRALAKSRGLKGFSKMKKGELLELLTGS
ncbi:Rho-N domain-containing protein 1 [Spatholobus suberectus]|nr:Rho-N domain-containing protein 1 [Spatholobus suberectus]